MEEQATVRTEPGPPADGGLRLTYRNRYGELWMLDATRETLTLWAEDLGWRPLSLTDPVIQNEFPAVGGVPVLVCAPDGERILLDASEAAWLRGALEMVARWRARP